MVETTENTRYYGDNLDVLRRHVRPPTRRDQTGGLRAPAGLSGRPA